MSGTPGEEAGEVGTALEADDALALEKQPDPSGHEGGYWLDAPPAEVRQAVIDAWKRQTPVAKKRMAKEQRNELLRAGIRNVRVVMDPSTDIAYARAPFGATNGAPLPNKADQLIRRIAATLTVDPPAGEVSPNSDTDQEREAAELSERILSVEGSPSDRDDVTLQRSMIDLGGTYGSVFILTELDPQGDGLVPLEIQAHPAAETADRALFDPTGDGVTPADPSELTTRYVAIDGRLSASPADAQMVWQPRVVESMLRPSQVRLLPAVGIPDAHDAQGVLIGQVRTLGQIIAQCYDGERPPEDVVKALTSWKPEELDWKQWVPKALREQVDQPIPMQKDGTIMDDALVVTLRLVLCSGPMAPHGATITIGGHTEPCHRDAWRVEIGEGDARRMEYLPLPIAHFRWREDTATGDVYGVAGIEDLGPMEEVRASAIRYTLDYMHRFGKPQLFLPVGTTVQPQQISARTGEPIYLNDGGKPIYEDIPTLSPVVQGVYDEMGSAMDTAAGLEAAAQGAVQSGVTTGIQQQQMVEQSLVSLAGIQQNANRCICRVWTNRLLFMRAYYTAPRIMRYGGEGADYQQRTWTGADLIGAGDVRIRRGTGTMLPRTAKDDMARTELQTAVSIGDTLGVQRYQRQISGGTTQTLGLQDDPHRTRIARQLDAWRQGAKQSYPPAAPPEPPQVIGVGPDGQPQLAPPPVDPIAQQAAQCFRPNPSDELPSVAPMRFQELADLIATKAFDTADPRWQQALYQEYERMRHAAGIMTASEQQQAQQQQQAAQQQAALEQAQVKAASSASKTAYAEDQGGPAGQRMAMQAAVTSAPPQGMEPQ